MPTDSGVEQDLDFIASTAGLYDSPRYRVRVQGESYDRLQILPDGTIVTGDGTATPTDTVATGTGFVAKSLYDANTILFATTDNTPAALTVGASTLVGRKATGAISAMSVAEAKTVLAYVVGDIPTAAPLASPTFTGNPAAPTQSAGDNSTKLATTAYANALVADAIADGVLAIAPSQNAVFDALALKSPLASPSFTGTVTSQQLTVSQASTTVTLTIDGSAAQNRNIGFASAGVFRWLLRLNNVAESGSDVGSDLQLISRTDAGSQKTVVLEFTRSTGGIIFGDAVNLTFNTATGTKIGTLVTEKIAFHGSTPVAQRSGAAQAAVITTAATNVTPYGFATQAQADAIVTLLNELRAADVQKGLIKGSA